MAIKNLENLLSDYEQKRRKAEMELEVRKQKLYKEYPELEDIDRELNKIAINKTKAILKGEKNINELDIEISNMKNKKEKFLKSKDIDNAFFEPRYECKICKDTGYVREADKTVMCSSLKQRLLNLSYNQSNLSDIKKENFENFNSSLFSDEINVNKYKIKCSPRTNINNIRKASEKFIEKFDDLEEKNLLFVG